MIHSDPVRPRAHRRLRRLVVLVGFLLALSLLPAVAWAVGASFTVRPVDAPVIAGFDQPAAPWLAGHRGVDFRAAARTPVRAPADAVVSFAGVVADRPVVSLRHSPLGVREVVSSFEPVVPAVVVGQRVRAGQVIGWMGSGGPCATRCVHWGLRVGGTYVDPLGMLAASVRLLPLDARPVELPALLPARAGMSLSAGETPASEIPPRDLWLRAVRSPL